MRNELLRKSAHTSLALSFAFLAPLVTQNKLVLLALALFIFFLLVRFFKLFESYIAVSRISYGELFFPFGIVGALLLSWPNIVLFQIAMVILAFADPLASLFGQSFGKHTYYIFDEKRTFEGSMVCFFTTFIICISFTTSFFFSLFAAGALVSVETFSLRGSDNFFIPVGVVFFAKVYENIVLLDVLNTIHM